MILPLVIGGVALAALSMNDSRNFVTRTLLDKGSGSRGDRPVVATRRPKRRGRRVRRRRKANGMLSGITTMLMATETQVLRAELDPSVLKAQEGRRAKSSRQIVFSLGAIGVTGVAALYPILTPLAIAAILFLSRETLTLIRNDFKRGHYFSMYLVGAVMTLGMILGGYLILAALSSAMMAAFAGLINRIEGNAEVQLVRVFKKNPEHVWILVDGVEVQAPFSALKVGDMVIVQAGEIIPVDGRVRSGLGQVDQHSLTGESAPVDKEAGDEVLASTLLVSGRLTIEVTVAGDETVAAKIGDLLNQTKSYKDTIMLRGRALGDRFLAPKLGLAAGVLPFLGLNGALAILWANLGQGLSVTGPLNILIYLQVLSRQQILIKDGRVFESLQKVDTVVFDKTGTLTQDQPTVGGVHPVNGFTEPEILRLAAAAEHRQPHPVARAIIARARAERLAYPVLEDACYEVGYGIKVRIAEQTVRVGSARFLQREGIALPETLDSMKERVEASGHSLIYVGVDGELAGVLELQPTIRPEAREIVATLKQRGLSVIILSGDHEAPTRAMADALEVDQYFAETLPENKAGLVEHLRKEGRFICFVGDGVNDAIALKAAQVSISIRGASTAATDTAQIVLMDGTLQRLTTLFELVDDYDVTMQRAVMLGFGPGAFTVAGALFFHFGVMISLMIVFLNMLLDLGNIGLAVARQRSALLDTPKDKKIGLEH